MTIKAVELGCPGHFVAASRCQYRRHTQVGNYRISTIGDYYPEGSNDRETIGLDRFFETMVFKTSDKPAKGSEGCGCTEVDNYSEIDFEPYKTAGDAQRGHEKLVKKYLKIAKKEAS